MLILRDSSHIAKENLGAVIALGNFDGLHLGHQSVIGKTVALAKQSSKPAAILTFEPHPRRVFKPSLPPLRIIPFTEKAHRVKEMGIDFMRVIRFTNEFAKNSAEEFIKNIVCKQLQASHIVTGDDFVFGNNREGNSSSLREMATKYGFSYTECPPVLIDKERCSSTRIRSLLAAGNVEEIEALLGRPYSITSIVQEGDKRGRQLGFPTANLLIGRRFTPATGVYAIKAIIDKKILNGVANLGTRPTFNGDRLQLEAHLFDWQQDIYGKHIEVILMKYLRQEQKFSDIDEIKVQISKDCELAKNILYP